MKNLKFSSEDKEKVKSAVNKAESATSGEIAVAMIGQSDDYASYELIFAHIVGFIYLMTIMFFVGPIEQILQQISWSYSINHLLAFYGFSTFLIITIFYLLANIKFIDRLIIPARVKRKKVQERATRYFMESGVYNTRDRTGILIFVSLLERRVEILADTGINALIEQQTWDSILNNIINGIKTDNFKESLLAAIKDCGDLLALHFPIKPDDTNELDDDIVILEK